MCVWVGLGDGIPPYIFWCHATSRMALGQPLQLGSRLDMAWKVIPMALSGRSPTARSRYQCGPQQCIG